MYNKILFLLLLLPGLAQAVICKSIDADGVVSYTKVPAATCPQPVDLPATQTFESQAVSTPAEAEAAEAAEPEPAFEGYRSITIMQPEADGVVRSNEGKVPVAVGLDPGLQPGHRIALYIDGKAVQGDFDGPAIELSGIERGTHSVRATVSDERGKLLASSPTVSFTLRKTGLYDSGANRPGPRTMQPIAGPRAGGS